MNAPAALARPPRRRPPAPDRPDGPRTEPPPVPRGRFSQSEYLAFERSPERASEARVELHADGKLVEMSGASFRHQLLVQDLTQSVRDFLDEEAFAACSEGMKFRPPACRFFYPDVMVPPNPPQFLDEVGDVVRNPVFVAEVLSDSTEATDRGEKQVCYLNTPSVLEYWLVSQDRVCVERHFRTDGTSDWEFEEYEDRAASVPLPALGGAVSLARLYRRALPAGPGA